MENSLQTRSSLLYLASPARHGRHGNLRFSTTFNCMTSDFRGDCGDAKKNTGKHLNVVETYAMLVKILRLKPMIKLAIILLTANVTRDQSRSVQFFHVQMAFAATDTMTYLKLIDAGVTTEKLASISLLMTPVHVGRTTNQVPRQLWTGVKGRGKPPARQKARIFAASR